MRLRSLRVVAALVGVGMVAGLVVATLRWGLWGFVAAGYGVPVVAAVLVIGLNRIAHAIGNREAQER